MDTCGRDAAIKYGETVSDGWRVMLPLTEDRRARGTIRLRRGRLRDKQPFSSLLAEARSSSFRGLPQPFLLQPTRHRLSNTFAAAWRDGVLNCTSKCLWTMDVESSLAAMRAASLHTLATSAPVKPGVRAASFRAISSLSRSVFRPPK